MKKISGEGKLVVEGVTFVLRADFSVLASIESTLDLGIIEVIEGMRRPKLSAVAAMLELLIADKQGHKAEDIVMNAGIVPASLAIADCLTRTLAPDLPGEAGKKEAPGQPGETVSDPATTG